MREDKKRKEKDLMSSQLLCSFVLQLLYLMQDQTMAMWNTPADGRPVKTMSVKTRLKRCSNFTLKHSQSLVIWVMFLRAVEKEEPIQYLIISA